MSDSNKKDLEISVPGEWALKQTLGPTFEAIGVDIAKLYEKSKIAVPKIALAAKNKITNRAGSKKDGFEANLRVARDVFWNGSFSEEQICAEYFGGVLASSRTSDGKDDSGVFYLDIIKSLSSTQLLLHYLIYSTINQLIVNDSNSKELNPGDATMVEAIKLFTPTVELVNHGIDYDLDLAALYQKGLVQGYKYGKGEIGDKPVHITSISPTVLGIQLFATASNELRSWREFTDRKFNNFEIKKKLNKAGFGEKDVV